MVQLMNKPYGENLYKIDELKALRRIGAAKIRNREEK
jgi:hypothetical protein